MANEATDSLISNESLKIPTRDYMREFVGTQMSIIDAKIDMLQQLNVATAASTQRAVEKAEIQMNTRLESMNEFRGQLKDQAATFMKIDQFVEVKEQLTARISNNETMMQHFVRKEDVDATRTALASRTDEIRGTLQTRLETTEKILANWQGRMVVFGAVWSVAVVVIGAFVNYAIRTATAPDNSAVISSIVNTEILKQNAAVKPPYSNTDAAIEELNRKIESIQKQQAPQR